MSANEERRTPYVNGEQSKVQQSAINGQVKLCSLHFLAIFMGSGPCGHLRPMHTHTYPLFEEHKRL